MKLTTIPPAETIRPATVTSEQTDRARRAVERHAVDTADRALLLAMLGLAP